MLKSKHLKGKLEGTSAESLPSFAQGGWESIETIKGDQDPDEERNDFQKRRPPNISLLEAGGAVTRQNGAEADYCANVQPNENNFAAQNW